MAGFHPICIGKVSNLHRGALTNLCHLVVSGSCAFGKIALGNSYHECQLP